MTLGHRIVVMKDGEVQQVDTPLRLYDFPANRFVAGFIGSPSMNFIKASVEVQGEKVYLSAPGFRIRTNPILAQSSGPTPARRSGWASAPSTWASRASR